MLHVSKKESKLIVKLKISIGIGNENVEESIRIEHQREKCDDCVEHLEKHE